MFSEDVIPKSANVVVAVMLTVELLDKVSPDMYICLHLPLTKLSPNRVLRTSSLVEEEPLGTRYALPV